MPLAARTRLGPYEVTAQIGVGGGAGALVVRRLIWPASAWSRVWRIVNSTFPHALWMET